jgi:hypothetical protein
VNLNAIGHNFNEDIRDDVIRPNSQNLNVGWSDSAEVTVPSAEPNSHEEASASADGSSDSLHTNQLDSELVKSADAPSTPLIQSTSEAITDLDQFATNLAKSNSLHAMVHMRKKAKQLGLPMTKVELEQIFSEAEQRELNHQHQPHKAGETVNVLPTNWLVPGILIRGVLNIVVGPPKVGKTALIIGVLGALCQEVPSFLGGELMGSCPPVLLVGTDQPLSDWYTMLRDICLMEEQPDGKALIREPISELYHSEHQITLNQYGITVIADWCSRHHDGLVILDSAVSLTKDLDLSENSSEFAKPFANLKKLVAPFRATVVVIHHSTKATHGFDPTQACRGTSAFPALASQLVALFPYPAPKGASPNPWIVLATKGRGGPPIQLVIERGVGTNWILHGTLEEVQAEEQQRNVSLHLTDRQALILSIVEEQQLHSGKFVTTALITPHLPADFRDPDSRLLRRTLKQLEAKGLIEVQLATTTTGLENRYLSKAVLQSLKSGELTDQGEEKLDLKGAVQAPCPPAGPPPNGDESLAAPPAIVPDPSEGPGSAEVLAADPSDSGQAGQGHCPAVRAKANEVADESEAVETSSNQGIPSLAQVESVDYWSPMLDWDNVFDDNPVVEDGFNYNSGDENEEFAGERAEELIGYGQLDEEPEGKDNQEVETTWDYAKYMQSP